MPQDYFPGESPDTTWAPPTDPEPDAPPAEPPKPVVDTAPLSTVALAAAGAGALNLLLTFACTVAWMMDEQMGLSIIGASSGLWVLLGIAAIGLGAYIQRQQKLAAVKGGTAGIIATVAILSGMFIMSGAVLLPLISAMRSIIAPSG
ncbi:MAG: hypothetical protein O3A53_04710 [Acidobacteria bacterium]|nr:hypothetical protein [Acidobacteriota bacterium]MDA1234082.1 hypothetical protein [Acidobacteriota bacterium]